MAIQFIYFDVGDTLLHKPGLFRSMATVLESAGHPIPVQRLRTVHTLLREETVFPPAPDRSFYHDFNAVLLERLEIAGSDSLTEGIYEACRGVAWQAAPQVAGLKNLPQRRGLLSNWAPGLSDLVARLLPVGFETVLSSADAQLAKPDPALFQRALARTGLPADQVLMIGDSPVLDIEPALAAGMHVLLYDRHGVHRDFSGPKITVLNEIAAHCDKVS